MRAGSVSFHTHTCTQTKGVPSRGSSTDRCSDRQFRRFSADRRRQCLEGVVLGVGVGAGVRLENRAVWTVSDFQVALVFLRWAMGSHGWL